MEFPYFKDSITPMRVLGRMTRVITEYQPFSYSVITRKENSLSISIMCLNPFPDLEGIILTHREMEQDTGVCHQKSFTRVNICLWQRNGFKICMPQEESGNTTHKVVIGTG